MSTKPDRTARALRIFLKASQTAIHLADCHPRHIAAKRRMQAMRPLLDDHPMWPVVAVAVRSARANVLRGL